MAGKKSTVGIQLDARYDGRESNRPGLAVPYTL